MQTLPCSTPAFSPRGQPRIGITLAMTIKAIQRFIQNASRAERHRSPRHGEGACSKSFDADSVPSCATDGSRIRPRRQPEPSPHCANVADRNRQGKFQCPNLQSARHALVVSVEIDQRWFVSSSQLDRAPIKPRHQMRIKGNGGLMNSGGPTGFAFSSDTSKPQQKQSATNITNGHES